ncbi:MAG: flavin reductase family protein [Gammaproteobacteria bacterium]|nr:flavin reductase family protein [Gammaproteobacteria bacterium]
MSGSLSNDTVSLDVSDPIWERFFMLAPLVLVGTKESDGRVDLAPKHMALPMGWQNYFGFVCTPRHATYANIKRTGVFTVTYPKPSQVLYASLAATPRGDANEKAVLQAFETVPATQCDGVFMADGYLFLECELFKIIDGFDSNSLVTGKVIAAHVHKDALRDAEQDDAELIRKAPMLAYIHPSRFAQIENTQHFPLPEGMER